MILNEINIDVCIAENNFKSSLQTYYLILGQTPRESFCDEQRQCFWKPYPLICLSTHVTQVK